MWHSLPVKDLTLIGRSNDGNFLELESKEGESYLLEINEALRALANQPRLVAVASPDEHSSVTVKEIQARLRAGEPAARKHRRATRQSQARVPGDGSQRAAAAQGAAAFAVEPAAQGHRLG
mgnify:CR=1 FL=1